MATIRSTKGNFHKISRALSQDENLSIQAVGLMTYLLSKPTNWEAQISDIQRRYKLGREACRSVIRELEKAGYLERIEVGKDGRFVYQIVVHETPLPPNKRSKTASKTPRAVDGSPVNGSPVNGSPVDGRTVDGSPVSIHEKELHEKELHEKETHTQAKPVLGVCEIPAVEKKKGSDYSQSVCTDFARWLQETKQGITNFRAYGKAIFRSGEDDVRIKPWLDSGRPATKAKPVEVTRPARPASLEQEYRAYYGLLKENYGDDFTPEQYFEQMRFHFAGLNIWDDKLAVKVLPPNVSQKVNGKTQGAGRSP